ncbi:putative alpha/beta hydrolase [Aspergillus novofumigatus IBT 16806]|uniref:Putative alpha/beta hydrolase n=1 Tax=Aspergillus novofumigatus (strain IBT 16806) TaxID=1392255 RepID=A0A2I1CC34_ASPN1|nr:putative alpha/beta hydrolase [Aspergillus novofumigatus IBT 16806]PKX95187.1 putative alpha/beta hydrolase [Aspergillus novofumigatus IBT 16806]
MATPGMLYVTMHPRSSLPAAQFHDWYNTEHGPLRVRLPFVTNGFRYRATDGLEPEWVALYDITDMVELTRETYLALRGDGIKTPREKATMAQIAVDRRLYDLLDDHKAPTTEDELNRWYREEHFEMLSRVPGWRRSRRFVTAAIDPNAPREFLSLYEYAAENGLEGPEHNAAKSTPWGKRISEIAISKKRRVYEWAYTFGPAPRELASLASKDVVGSWHSNDNRTRTYPSPTRPAVESYVTTKDGVSLPYRLEGSTDPTAPVIVLSNSILVDWSIWDGFVDAFLSNPKNQNYRILRYLTRGRLRECGETPITIDVLASDIIALLDALRIPQATLIGVSLGGVTVLNTALLYPSRVTRFIACDTNSSAPESNRKAWTDRHAMAASEGAVSPDTQEPIIGEKLAEATTRRWFVPETYETQPEVPARVKEVVRLNSLEGFHKGMQALCAYDVRERMASARVPGLFVAGDGDGVLPQTMQKMAADLKGGADLKIIPKAGHLPMVEQPQAFTEVVNGFLHL